MEDGRLDYEAVNRCFWDGECVRQCGTWDVEMIGDGCVRLIRSTKKLKG